MLQKTDEHSIETKRHHSEPGTALQGVERLCLPAYDSDKAEADSLRSEEQKISGILAVLAGSRPPYAGSPAALPLR